MDELLLQFAPGSTLAERNEAFRQACLKMDPHPEVHLLLDGFHPLPLAESKDVDAMACQGMRLRGTFIGERIIVN